MATVRMTDNSQQVLDQMRQNVKAALTAMGETGVELVVENMQHGYGRPIWQTGDLQRDVSYEVEASGPNTVDVGSSLDYAPHVHDGTYKMKGRPYIRDALASGNTANVQALREVAAEYLKQGF